VCSGGAFCFLSAFGAWSADCVSPPAGLVSWWPGQGNANDIAGANNGTLSGGVTFTNGEVGQAFNFDGVSGYVEIASNSNLNPAASFSIEGWIFPRQDRVQQIMSKWADTPDQLNQRSYAFFTYTNEALGFGISDLAHQWDVSFHKFFTTNNVLNLNTWSHVAAVYDQPAGARRIYVNGVKVAERIDPPITVTNSTARVGIGAGLFSSTGSREYFDGLIDELSFYSVALSAAEIEAIYNGGSAGKCRLAPTPRTATATATVVNDFVVGATITDGGYGYTNTPIVRIIGGGGSGAQAVAVVNNGVVVAVNFLDAGSGYTSTPLIVIDPPFIPNPVLDITPMSFLTFSNLTLGGVYQLQQWMGWYWSNQPVSFTATNTLYTQMVAGVADSGDYRLALNPVPAQAFATAQVVNGFVVGATVTSGGSGYVTSPAVTIIGAGGTNATAISHISGGVVTSISIIDAGNGYTNAPTVRIAPPPAAAVSPTVLPVMRVDSANLAPYDNYQIQFKSDLGGTWGNWNGGLFSPTDVTNSQYLFITNAVGFFRLEYLQNVP
jgi:hypothetical protein